MLEHMSRLWDKGTSLDARVLEYTAGDDHALDNRLVAYDIRASIAHAEMLGEQNLLSPADLAAIREALTAIGDEHAQGRWRISLEQEDCQTAIENLLTARIGRGRRPAACRALEKRSGAGSPAALPARCGGSTQGWSARSGARARSAGRTARPSRASRLYPHAAGHAKQRRALGFGICRGTARRCRGTTRHAAAHRQEPLGIRGRIRHPESRHQPRSHAPAPGVCGHSRAGDRGAVVARQSRGAAAVRNHAADARPRPARGRPVAVLFAGIRLCESAGDFHHRLFDHAAETQSRCLRAGARTQRRRAGGAERSLGHHAKADLGLSPRFAADQAAVVSRHRFVSCRPWPFCRAHSTACAFARRTSGWIRAFTPPPRRMRWWPRKAFPFARPTGGSPQNSRTTNEHLAQPADRRGVERQPGRNADRASRHFVHRNRRGLRSRHHARRCAYRAAVRAAAWRSFGGARRNLGEHGRCHVRRCRRVPGRGPGNQCKPCARGARRRGHGHGASGAPRRPHPCLDHRHRQCGRKSWSAFRASPWRSSSAAPSRHEFALAFATSGGVSSAP